MAAPFGLPRLPRELLSCPDVQNRQLLKLTQVFQFGVGDLRPDEMKAVQLLELHERVYRSVGYLCSPDVERLKVGQVLELGKTRVADRRGV